MRNPTAILPTTRREFLRLSSRGVGLLAFSQFAPNFLVQSTRAATPAPERDRSILVLVQLAGGNDGLNTVVPFEDANYHRLRPTLALARQDVLPVTDQLGLHPALAPLRALHGDGKLSIIQNVGYPNPNRSHFRSMEIWETGSGAGEFLGTGWIGRYLDNTCAGAPGAAHADPHAGAHDSPAARSGGPLAVHASNEYPQCFHSDSSAPTFGIGSRGANRREDEAQPALLEALTREAAPAANANASFLKQTLMDTLVTEKKVADVIARYRTEATYPGGAFALSLRNVAALIAARFPTRVYFVSLGGFDTHANQANTHAGLLTQLAEGLAAFQRDLDARGLGSQVLTMTFSEFGRRPGENQSRGTDHGTAAPLFVLGSAVKGGVLGTAPDLAIPANSDLQFTTDFRSIYSTVLDRWMGCDPRLVLDGDFERLGFV